MKVGAVLCAALVTVLLGLQVADAQIAGLLKNVALALGAAITVIKPCRALTRGIVANLARLRADEDGGAERHPAHQDAEVLGVRVEAARR